MKKRICIIGCGTHGSYLVRRLMEVHGEDAEITVIEIGGEKTVTEAEIGLASDSKSSKASHLGRYFGLGGTSTRWGGQILFFDTRDDVRDDENWRKIIGINAKYREKVINTLMGNSGFFKKMETGDRGNYKSGIWLRYDKRNLFNHIGKERLGQVKIVKNTRVVDFECSGQDVVAVICKDREGKLLRMEADLFYLTAGAIESCRLLLQFYERHHILGGTDVGKNLGDHVSLEVVKVRNAKPILEGVDFTPQIHDGSLITKRLVVYSRDGRVGYLHAVFNQDVKIFSALKKMLFGRQKMDISAGELMRGLWFMVKFGFSFVVLKKLYVDRREWVLRLDVEQPFPNGNELRINGKVDKYNESVVVVDWCVTDADREFIEEAKAQVIGLLERSGISNFEALNDEVSSEKIEDIYHPVGFMRVGNDSERVTDYDGRVNGFGNLYHFSTGMFPSAKSINPSAAVFCMIEAHLFNGKWKMENKENDLLNFSGTLFV